MGFHLQDGDTQFENVDPGGLEGQKNWELEQVLFQDSVSAILRKSVPLGSIFLAAVLFIIIIIIKNNAYVFISQRI